MAQAALLAAQQGNNLARANLGSDYGRTRSITTWGYSALVGFVPLINPVMMPFQIAMMITFLIIYWLVVGFGFVTSALAAWITAGLVMTVIVHFFLSAATTVVFGKA